MQFRSSILSFDTLCERIRVSKAAVLTLVFCAVFRAVLFLGNDLIASFPRRGLEFMSIEQRCIRDIPAPAKVLLMGSSRIRYAVVSDVVADELGLPRDQVQNITLRAGGPLDALILLRRNPHLLDNAKLVVFDINPWQLNLNGQFLVPPRLHYIASLSERLRLFDLAGKCEVLWDCVWPSNRERRTLARWMENLWWLAKGAKYSTDWNPWWAPGEHGQAGEEAALRHMQRFEVCQLMEESWREFVDLLDRRGIPLVIIETPTLEMYYTTINETPEYRKGYEKYLDIKQSLARPGVHFKTWLLPEDAGLTDDDLFDYGHLAKNAALKFSRVLAAYLRDEGLDKDIR